MNTFRLNKQYKSDRYILTSLQTLFLKNKGRDELYNEENLGKKEEHLGLLPLSLRSQLTVTQLVLPHPSSFSISFCNDFS